MNETKLDPIYHKWEHTRPYSWYRFYIDLIKIEKDIEKRKKKTC